MRKTDVDNVARGYIRDRFNSLNPFHSGWYPSYTNTAMLAHYSLYPSEATPSSHPGALANDRVVAGAGIKRSVVVAGNYYTRIARGYSGLQWSNWGNSGSGSGIRWYNESWWALNDNAPGQAAKRVNQNNRVSSIAQPSGTITYQSMVNALDAVYWQLIGPAGNLTVNLTMCHDSCHSNCHGSRGRR